MQKNNSALFFTCSLIEYISRITKNKRNAVVKMLGGYLQNIYDYADVFHCEPIEKVADDFITKAGIENGSFDNVASCKYSVPDYWDIGEVFERLIEDCYSEDETLSGIRRVYDSWMADKILDFNSDLYYQSRDYIKECYRAGSIL